MPTFRFTCGHCGATAGVDDASLAFKQNSKGHHWRLAICPSCTNGVAVSPTNQTFPGAPAGGFVNNLPPDVEHAWGEVRTSHAVGAFTAAEMMCRKILMHIAVDVASSPPGRSFVEYVDALDAAGYITAGLKPTIDKIRQRGNTATHDLTASTEDESLQTIRITEHLLRGTYELNAP